MNNELNVPDQPDGITSDSFDLPTPGNAAKRVGEFLEWWGDGLIDPAVDSPDVVTVPPLYARDLQALVNTAWDRDLLLWLHAEAVWQREQEGKRLRARVHEAVNETQRRYGKYQSRCASFDTWSKWAREHAERMGDDFWTHTSQAHRLYVMSLHEEIDRLRREVEFEANGCEVICGAGWRDNIRFPLCSCFTAEQFAALDTTRWSRPQCAVHPDGSGVDLAVEGGVPTP